MLSQIDAASNRWKLTQEMPFRTETVSKRQDKLIIEVKSIFTFISFSSLGQSQQLLFVKSSFRPQIYFFEMMPRNVSDKVFTEHD